AGGESSGGGASLSSALLSEALLFLRWLDAPEQKDVHERQAEAVGAWARATNEGLRAANLPLTLRCEHCVWSLHFEKVGRFHWLLQLLLRDLGCQLDWIAPGQLSFPLQTTPQEFDALRSALLQAAAQMREAGWWADPSEVGLSTDAQFRYQLAKEVRLQRSALLTLISSES
ncbi:MAG: hypothetical protein SGPRY_011570, partial [Prymnesium sp.]